MYYDIMFMFCYLGAFVLALYNKKGRILSFLFLVAMALHLVFAELLLEPLGSNYPVYYYVSLSLLNMLIFLNVFVLEERLAYRVPILLMIIIPYVRALDIHLNYFGYTLTFYLYNYAVPLINGWLIYNLIENDKNENGIRRGSAKWFSNFGRNNNTPSDIRCLERTYRTGEKL